MGSRTVQGAVILLPIPEFVRVFAPHDIATHSVSQGPVCTSAPGISLVVRSDEAYHPNDPTTQERLPLQSAQSLTTLLQ
jgi:hypothetical protein